MTYVWEGLGAFAVPCFLMLTGAFTICNKKTENVLAFWKKSITKFLPHTIFFSLIYFVWPILVQGGIIQFIVYRENMHISQNAIITQLILWMKGWPGHPMWYMYTLLGIYIMIPFFSILYHRFKSYKNYHIVAFLFVVWTIASANFESCSTSWSIGRVITYMGYVVLGSEIRCLVKEKKIEEE